MDVNDEIKTLNTIIKVYEEVINRYEKVRSEQADMIEHLEELLKNSNIPTIGKD